MGEATNKQRESARAREVRKRAAVERHMADLGLIDRAELAHRAGLTIPGTSAYLRSGFLKPSARVGEGRTAVMLFRPEDADRLRRHRLERGGTHPLLVRRIELGLLQRVVASRAGCVPSFISLIENRRAMPSVALARRIAAAVNADLEEVFGPPRACMCGCGGPTFVKYCDGHAAAKARRVRPKHIKELASYKRQHRLLDADEVASAAGCHPSTIKEHARAGRLDGVCERYLGNWPREDFRPWLFKAAATSRVTQILAEGKERQRAAAHAVGLMTGPTVRAFRASPAGQELSRRQAERLAVPPLERQCDLCGDVLRRKPSAVHRNDARQWRFRCGACERDWQTAIMRARQALDLPRPDCHLHLANRRAIDEVFRLADELDQAIATRVHRRGRPRDAAARLVIDALYCWRDFSDQQIADLFRAVGGREVNRTTVKRLRIRYGIRRRRRAA